MKSWKIKTSEFTLEGGGCNYITTWYDVTDDVIQRYAISQEWSYWRTDDKNIFKQTNLVEVVYMARGLQPCNHVVWRHRLCYQTLKTQNPWKVTLLDNQRNLVEVVCTVAPLLPCKQFLPSWSKNVLVISDVISQDHTTFLAISKCIWWKRLK